MIKKIVVILFFLAFAQIESTLRELQWPQKRIAKSSLLTCLKQYNLADLVTGRTGKFKFTFNERLNGYKVNLLGKTLTPDQVTSNMSDYICNKVYENELKNDEDKNICLEKVKTCSNIFLSLLSKESPPTLISKLRQKISSEQSSKAIQPEEPSSQSDRSPSYDSSTSPDRFYDETISKDLSDGELPSITVSPNRHNGTISKDIKIPVNIHQPRYFKPNKPLKANGDLTEYEKSTTVLTEPPPGLKLGNPNMNQTKSINIKRRDSLFLDQHLSQNKDQTKIGTSDGIVTRDFKLSDDIHYSRYFTPKNVFKDQDFPRDAVHYKPPKANKSNEGNTNINSVKQPSRYLTPNNVFKDQDFPRDAVYYKPPKANKSNEGNTNVNADDQPSRYLTPKNVFKDQDFSHDTIHLNPFGTNKSNEENTNVNADKQPLKYFIQKKKNSKDKNLSLNRVQSKILKSVKSTNIEPSDDMLLPSRHEEPSGPFFADLDFSQLEGQSETIVTSVEPSDVMLLPTRYEEPSRTFSVDLDFSHLEEQSESIIANDDPADVMLLPKRYEEPSRPFSADLDFSHLEEQSESIIANDEPSDVMLLPKRYEEPDRPLSANLDFSHLEAPVVKPSKPTTIDQSPILDYFS